MLVSQIVFFFDNVSHFCCVFELRAGKLSQSQEIRKKGTISVMLRHGDTKLALIWAHPIQERLMDNCETLAKGGSHLHS